MPAFRGLLTNRLLRRPVERTGKLLLLEQMFV